MNHLVSLKYKVGAIIKEEIVESSSERFFELIKKGVESIDIADKNAKIGISKSFGNLVYREDGETITKQISYRKNNENKISMDNFNSFLIRGLKVDRTKTKYGDLLCLAIGTTNIVVYDKEKANDIVYVIRNLQDFNAEILDELYPDWNKKDAEEIEEKSNETEEKK